MKKTWSIVCLLLLSFVLIVVASYFEKIRDREDTQGTVNYIETVKYNDETVYIMENDERHRVALSKDDEFLYEAYFDKENRTMTVKKIKEGTIIEETRVDLNLWNESYMKRNRLK